MRKLFAGLFLAVALNGALFADCSPVIPPAPLFCKAVLICRCFPSGACVWNWVCVGHN